MAALSGIKRRIRSVTSTKQITKAMQLVAASKLRRAQESATGPQDYTEAAKEILSQLSSGVEAQRNTLFQVRAVERVLTIIVGGDRGMAGAYNSNITKAFIKHASRVKATHQVIVIGRRAASYSAHLSGITELAAYEMDINEPDIGLAKPILDEVVELFRDGKIDSVNLVYTHFVSTIKQETVVEQLLPVRPSSGSVATISELEPSSEELLDYVVMRVLEAQLLQAILESRASEQAARMVAMLNATDNATEIISDLTLEFNNARQGAITQELAEISGGAEAINA